MSAGVAVNTPAFQFKGSMLPFTVIELDSVDLERIAAALPETLAQAPGFFEHAAVVVGVEKVADSQLDVVAVVDLLRSQRLLPIAVRGGGEVLAEQARGIGLAWFPAAAEGTERRAAPARRPNQRRQEAPAVVGRTHRGTVRSGQQVVALDGDLVVVGAVNPGAEVLAAGSVHVYGPLRGRALAGIHGDPGAAIYCRELDAELVSIAGSYKRLEDIDAARLGRPAQIRLDGEQLQISALD